MTTDLILFAASQCCASATKGASTIPASAPTNRLLLRRKNGLRGCTWQRCKAITARRSGSRENSEIRYLSRSRESALDFRKTNREWQMDAIGLLKSWIGALTDIGLMLLALAIVASLLVGGTLPFFGGVVANIVSMVKDLGSNGLVGLIAVGLIMWLFSKRSLA